MRTSYGCRSVGLYICLSDACQAFGSGLEYRETTCDGVETKERSVTSPPTASNTRGLRLDYSKGRLCLPHRWTLKLSYYGCGVDLMMRDSARPCPVRALWHRDLSRRPSDLFLACFDVSLQPSDELGLMQIRGCHPCARSAARSHCWGT